MCIVIGKYFKNKGWVAFKNRDRNYIPEITFKKKLVNGVEILYFFDTVTSYLEGLNSAGIGVLSASLMVMDDEKEIEVRSKTPSKDGIKIKKALEHASITEVAKSLIELKLTGNTLIFNKDTMYLLEGAWEKGGYKKEKFLHVIKEIPKNETVVRTNHGVWLSHAGYQRGVDDSQTQSRISSESRKLIAEIVTHVSQSPIELIDGLTKDFTGNGQMNALRTSTKVKMMRTTSQIMIIPKEQTMFVRPVQSNLQFNFWELNHPAQQTWVELLSNRVLYANLKNADPTDDPPFDYHLLHNAEEVK